MTANKRRAFLNIARPFVPLFAEPTGGLTAEARQMFIYIYPTAATPPPVTNIFPLYFTITLDTPMVNMSVVLDSPPVNMTIAEVTS